MKSALDDMTWWMMDNTCIGMGAQRQFDYTMRGDLGRDLTPRLGHCYMLAMQAFTGWDEFTSYAPNRAEVQTSLPAPSLLVHGFWKHPAEDKGINHAWVVLEDGRMWEPITGLICDRVLFTAFSDAKMEATYTGTQARRMMLRHQHYGPWHVDL